MEALIRQWRETQIGQSSNRSMPERINTGIPTETRSTESRSFEQNNRNFMPAFRIPAFDGKSDWKIWLNRFVAITQWRRWSAAQKLDELLSRLQGTARDFVFAQLLTDCLSQYDIVISEITNRFIVIDTPEVHVAWFNSRDQKANEKIEDYVAELKRMFGKDFGHCDETSRQFLLKRRFPEDKKETKKKSRRGLQWCSTCISQRKQGAI